MRLVIRWTVVAVMRRSYRGRCGPVAPATGTPTATETAARRQLQHSNNRPSSADARGTHGNGGGDGTRTGRRHFPERALSARAFRAAVSIFRRERFTAAATITATVVVVVVGGAPYNNKSPVLRTIPATHIVPANPTSTRPPMPRQPLRRSYFAPESPPCNPGWTGRTPRSPGRGAAVVARGVTALQPTRSSPHHHHPFTPFSGKG